MTTRNISRCLVLSLFPLGLSTGLVGCDTTQSDLATIEQAQVLFGNGDPQEEALAETLAFQHLNNFAAIGLVSDVQDLRTRRITIDDLAMAHVRLQQTVNGVPVYGGEAIVHMYEDGELRDLTDKLLRNLQVDTEPSYSAEEAIELAVQAYEGWEVLTDDPTAQLWVLRHDGADYLAYAIQLDRQDGTDLTSRPLIFIDAHSGQEIWRYENLKTGAATGTGNGNYNSGVTLETYLSGGTYYLENASADLGTYTYNNTWSSLYYLTDSDNSWTSSTQASGVDAHYAGTATLDYYYSTFGRNGLDGSGGPGYISSITGSGSVISILVNYGNHYANGYWAGSYLVLGDGDGVTLDPLTSVDVVGHEMTHGVTEDEAGLIYYGQSGAIDESIADVFGAMVERSVYGESADTWMVGEDCYTPAISWDAMRYMDDPTADGYSVDHYDDLFTGAADSGGVHMNSGISNLAFYLLSEGGSHPTYGGSMTGIGADDAAEIWYRALTLYFTSSTDFDDFRTASLNAAEDLFGAGSTQYSAVGDAWSLVGVGDSGGSGSGDCTGYDNSYSGTLTGTGDYDAQPDGSSYYSGRGFHEGYLSGPASADFDLYLYYYRLGTWTEVGASESSSSEETISFRGRRGYYVWYVYSYSGSGDYTLCTTTP